MPELATAVGAIQGGGFVKTAWDRLHPCQKYDHIKTSGLPDDPLPGKINLFTRIVSPSGGPPHKNLPLKPSSNTHRNGGTYVTYLHHPVESVWEI